MQTASAQDSIFYDPTKALEIARQQNRVARTHWISGLQVCYYVGNTILLDAPENLVHVPLESMAEFFSETRLRLPAAVVLPNPSPQDDPQERLNRNRFATLVQRAMNEAGRRMERISHERTKARASQRVTVATDEPLRVFAGASTSTTVMQYCTRGMLDAFARLGHQTRLSIEQNDMERICWHEFQRESLEFHPHIVLNINHQNQELTPPGGVNVIWWQDQMECLTKGARLRWRDNDLVYVVMTNRFAPMLEATGLPRERIKVQPFCIDRSLFNDEHAGEYQREDKVVFVGSSYCTTLSNEANEKKLLAELEERFTAGEGLTSEIVIDASRRHGVTQDHAVRSVQFYVARDLPVRWLCQQRDVPVEIYGREWQRDPVVAPFFKGELPQGKPIADLYRRARWALVLHPELINHQRLGEVGACGCIPLVYDCRHQADGPFWEDQALYFRTQAQLRTALEHRPTIDAQAFGEFFDYANFARRIVADAQPFFVRTESPSLAVQT
ncbi:MAG TPA: hypothetical protein VHX44_09180 [Planctomycetota bacterium]|nr:hypothetical protein [Planctomycetota bacterium]